MTALAETGQVQPITVTFRIQVDPAAFHRVLTLTPRETQILQVVAEGLTDPQIARRLHISERTIHTHLRNINVKLDTATRFQAVLAAIRAGAVRL
jgi:DNA-binding NarL/FixJ family response regulator